MDWQYKLFPQILNMSLTASVVIIFVILARILLKKAPKIFSYALWWVVLFRLLCPISLSAPISLLHLLDAPVVEGVARTSRVEYIPANLVHTKYPQVTLPMPTVSDAINRQLPQGWVQVTFDPLEAPIAILTLLWLLGMVGMLGYSVISWLRLRYRLIGVIHLHDNIFMVDHIASPFVFGLVKPRIYLLSSLSEEEQEYMILHEQHHIKRRDYIWKALAFLALAIHWFNPLVWVAFILAGKDMEMSCDEAVIRKLGEEARADYSVSLLKVSVGGKLWMGLPPAFGEGDTKGRIRNLAHWKKTRIWILIAALMLCGTGILLCAVNPKAGLIQPPESFGQSIDDISNTEVYKEKATSEEVIGRTDSLQEKGVSVETDSMEADQAIVERNLLKERTMATGTDSLEAAITAAILDINRDSYKEGLFSCESHIVFDMETASGTPLAEGGEHIQYVTVYAMVLVQKYNLSSGRIVGESGSHMPVAITFQVNEAGEYTLEEYWMPKDGSGYEDSIRERFPDSIEDKAMDTQKYILSQKQNCYHQTIQYSGLDTDYIVAGLLDEILAAPGLEAESGLALYLQAKQIEYRELTWYGAYTLQYCFQEFLKGNQTDLRGLFMWEVCRDIMEGFGEGFLPDIQPTNGQEGFEAFRKRAESLGRKLTQQELAERYPASWILWQLLEETSVQGN